VSGLGVKCKRSLADTSVVEHNVQPAEVMHGLVKKSGIRVVASEVESADFDLTFGVGLAGQKLPLCFLAFG
jgi:hypothetical protein